MPNAIFDVDGTLTATTGVDDHSLSTAWSRVFGIREHDIDTDWTTYAHSTDEGLTLEVAQRHLHREPTRVEVGEVQREFFALLRERIVEDPKRCIPVPGVHEMLAALAERGWSIGIASGAWEESARIKLAAAGVPAAHLPGTFSHRLDSGGTGSLSARDAATSTPATREDIIRGTLAKLQGHAPLKHRPVYIGDGPWDARAARNLHFGFIGIRVDNNHARLKAEGATTIFPNYTNLPALLDSITLAARQ
jgi:phosphoglycolate phosphatase-like HAD superfamily hydrolase